MENFPGVGCQLADATGLLFSGGTFEACGTGLIVSGPSDDNMFVKLWMEANATGDAIVSGNGNGFIGGKFLSLSSGPNIRILSDASGTWFAGGGYIRAVHVAADALGTSFHQVGIDENISGTVGFQGLGHVTRVTCRKIGLSNVTTGMYPDIHGTVQSIGNGGVWKPVLHPAHGKIVLNEKLTQGSYQRIGPMIVLQCFIYVADVVEAGGEIRVGGLPWLSAQHHCGSVHATQLKPAADAPLQLRVDPGSQVMILSKLVGGQARAMADDIKADTTLTLSMTYIAAG